MAPNIRSSSDNKLLAALPRAQFDRLAPYLFPEALIQGLVLREPGEKFDQVYFPHSGMLSLLVVMRNEENAIETATVGREGVVGAMTGLGNSESSVRVVVQLPMTVSTITAPKFRRSPGRATPSVICVFASMKFCCCKLGLPPRAMCSIPPKLDFVAGYYNRRIGPRATPSASSRIFWRRCLACDARRSPTSPPKYKLSELSPTRGAGSKSSTGQLWSACLVNAMRRCRNISDQI